MLFYIYPIVSYALELCAQFLLFISSLQLFLFLKFSSVFVARLNQAARHRNVYLDSMSGDPYGEFNHNQFLLSREEPGIKLISASYSLPWLVMLVEMQFAVTC